MTVIIILFFVIQVIGEILEFKGKIVPEFVKIRKYFQRRKQERQTTQEACKTLIEVKALLADVGAHYCEDNIKKRDGWISEVNRGLAESREHWESLKEMVLSMMIEDRRTAIIDFAARVAHPDAIATREEFKRIFKIHREYESIIEKQGLTNGEVTIAIRMIKEAYEERLRNRTFVEDIRGYEG